MINKNIKSTKKQTHPAIFTVDGNNITNQDYIANAFNNYFINIGENMVKTIAPTKLSFDSYMPSDII